MAEKVLNRRKDKSEQATASDQDGNGSLDTEQIIHSITVNITAAMETKFNKFAETLDTIASKVHNNTARLGVLDIHVSDMEDKANSMDSILAT